MREALYGRQFDAIMLMGRQHILPSGGAVIVDVAEPSKVDVALICPYLTVVGPIKPNAWPLAPCTIPRQKLDGGVVSLVMQG